MDTGMLAAIMLILGVALGLLIAISIYASELARMARWLERRDSQSNARLTVHVTAPCLSSIASAINAELERTAEDRVTATRHAQEFQRDLSALSHDIRTPLMGAKGYLQLAEDETDPASRARHLSAATQRIDATTGLLDQLFSYAKASDPDLALEQERIVLKPLIEAVLLAHYPEFEQRGWEPGISFADDRAAFTADRSALTRIVENLVSNALRYGASAPAIEQSGGAITFSNRVADPAAIDPDRLFDRFYQADTARGSAGSGLGLATAAKLAKAMGLTVSASLAGDTLAIRLAKTAPKA